MTHKQRIILFVNNINFITLGIIAKNYLIKNYNLNVVFFFDTDIFKIREEDIVIPVGLGACKVCYNLQIKNTLVNYKSVYDTLNLKSECYVYAQKLGLANIPTFPNFKNDVKKLKQFIRDNRNISGKFLAKQIRGAASTQQYIYDEIDLVKVYNKFMLTDYVIQPYLNLKKVITFDCVCVDGEIKEYIVEEKLSFYDGKSTFFKLQNKSWRKFITLQCKHVDKIMEDSKKVAKDLNYNGFLELEYCVTATDQLLFMEINPRVCWVALTYIKDKNSPYIDRLFIEFIKQCIIKKIRTISDKNNDSKDLLMNLNKVERFSDNQLMLHKANNYQSSINKMMLMLLYIMLILILIASYHYVKN
jgi:hypothetical protein